MNCDNCLIRDSGSFYSELKADIAREFAERLKRKCISKLETYDYKMHYNVTDDAIEHIIDDIRSGRR